MFDKEYLVEKLAYIDGKLNVWALFNDAKAFEMVVEALAVPLRGKVDAIVATESRGFILGGAVAHYLNLGLVGVRKQGGYFPGELEVAVSEPDYSGLRKTFVIQKGALPKSSRAALVEDWIETGSSALAVKELVAKEGSSLVAVSAIVDQLYKEVRPEFELISGLLTDEDLVKVRKF